ncbi:hypothetical protein [Streptomyces griseoflavus]|uniref:hypothetical protein n=1 Tax=Streptomyces griseoflavus TaxID=35619 RepID=UPI0019A373A4|nr:hypothetical protein [Streptomyces griseoflavus]GGV17898.1 hypothetical protein GCM10010293_11780 [Streptomyces griseoflavus]
MIPFPHGARFLAAPYVPGGDAQTIINLLAWCVSAGGVFGLIVIGTNMAIQLNRGDPGEGSSHFRGVFFVALACLVASTARPLVGALGSLELLGP